ncbi:hypothetical protein Tco_1185496 [Tanacetum coccineum]
MLWVASTKDVHGASNQDVVEPLPKDVGRVSLYPKILWEALPKMSCGSLYPKDFVGWELYRRVGGASTQRVVDGLCKYRNGYPEKDEKQSQKRQNRTRNGKTVKDKANQSRKINRRQKSYHKF